ncbi:hypothetical protein JXM67_10380 [candidate division WOR-3 bacterium]|nr:hypothetical protein [candidate division WOR-3 bacterium]
MQKIKMLGILTLAGLLSTGAVLDCSKKTVKAQEIVLVDAGGNVRGMFGFSDDTQIEPGVWLYDDAGNVRLSVTLLDDGSAGMAIADQKGDIRILLSTDEEDLPAIYLIDQAGELRTLIDIDEKESPGIYFYDQTGDVRAMMMVFDDGTPDLSLFNDEGEIYWGSP